MHSFNVPDDSCIQNARFNKKGSRLLCVEAGTSPAIYGVPLFPSVEESDATRLIAPGYKSKEGDEGCCFAGKNDELAVVASSDKKIYVWSVPEGDEPSKVDSPLLVLTGHKGYVN